MANGLARQIGLVVVAIGAIQSSAAHAEEFVSNQYGFRFAIPVGFHAQADDMANAVAKVVEEDKALTDYPIAIYFAHVGQEVNSSAGINTSQLPHKEGWLFSVDTPRKWREIVLPTIRREAPLIQNTPFVSYIVQFPLKGEGVQMLVQGPKGREREIVKVFDESLRSFTNLKPYLVSVERIEPGKATRAATEFLLTVLPGAAVGALLIFWLIRIRKPYAKQVCTIEFNRDPVVDSKE